MIIGLTGGIASGKSTVAAMLESYGLPIIDADVIAREVVEPGEKAYKEIVQAFGEEILLSDGHLDRKKLGSIIFRDEEKRRQLNTIVHPAVRAEMKKQAEDLQQAGYPTIVMDIPLLIESNLLHMVDKVLLVYVSPETQQIRLMRRDQSKIEEASHRINAQMPIDDKKAYATEIVINEGSIEETEKQLKKVLEKWRVRIL